MSNASLSASLASRAPYMSVATHNSTYTNHTTAYNSSLSGSVGQRLPATYTPGTASYPVCMCVKEGGGGGGRVFLNFGGVSGVYTNG